jgi:hypothetical protein
VVNEAGAHYRVTGTVDLITAGTGGTFTNDGSFVRSGMGGTDVTVAYVNQADVTVSSGSLNFLGGISNSGTMTAAGAHMTVRHAITGAGTLDISAAGTMTLGAGSDIGQTVDFLTGGGTLGLAAPGTFAGKIAGFGTGDLIDLIKTPATSEKFAAGVLTVKNGSAVIANLHFSGSYTSSSFALSSDAHGGTLIHFV